MIEEGVSFSNQLGGKQIDTCWRMPAQSLAGLSDPIILLAKAQRQRPASPTLTPRNLSELFRFRSGSGTGTVTRRLEQNITSHIHCLLGQELSAQHLASDTPKSNPGL